ncbi:hypothetical protein F5Y10DRAFT_93761 [Nemania abortiva]|nr:hypothetical protein F5Y10DRAFT_93761 [Nemania abortiva]
MPEQTQKHRSLHYIEDKAITNIPKPDCAVIIFFSPPHSLIEQILSIAHHEEQVGPQNKSKQRRKVRKNIHRVVTKNAQTTPSTAARHGMTLRNGGLQGTTHKQARPTSQADASALPGFSTIEPVVRASSPLPQGYKFLPKGNPYMTRNCRQRTQLAHQVVYAVVNDEKKQVGIRIPASIHDAVEQSERSTRQSRQQNVMKHDKSVEECFRKAILDRFPQIPPRELRMVMSRATQKGQGRVGRTGTIEMEEKARLATQAHIRHTKTDYDKILKGGTGRESARKSTFQIVLDISKQWGLVPATKSTRKKAIKMLSNTRLG